MKNKKLFILLLLIPIIIFFIGRSFSIEEEVKSVEIQSEDYNEPGGWYITKSADWIDTNKARVTFDVNSILKTNDERYKDVILVIDISDSMMGDRLDRAKADAIELVDFILTNSHNNIALIVFDTTSEIKSEFINDKNEMISILNNLTVKGNTNYNSALQNVDIVMSNYIQRDNTDLITLFLTDGYPNEDTPNQVSTYHMLKDKYPYMTINGIQYEMGRDVIQEITDISDNQWIADQNTLHNVLFDAVLSPLTYANFVITDFINNDYFQINSEDDIKISLGKVNLIEESGEQKILWDLSNSYKAGESAEMFIDLQLKEEYHDTKGYYPTNKRETIKSKLPDEREKIVDSLLTPVLKSSYYVIYDTNTPTGCVLSNYDSEEHFVYQNITRKKDKLSCPEYLFNGWEIDNNDRMDMTIINDNLFIMPSHDVHIRATWTRQKLVKKMDGEVHVKMTLYKVLQNEASTGTYAKKYNGNHQDSVSSSGTSDIYYYYADNQADAETIIKEKNNVIFANHCWQMYRTTDTGGVKLIYNGEPEDNKCMNAIGNQTGRSNHIGYAAWTTQNLSGSYYYGTDYKFENGSFKLSGTLVSRSITSSNASSVIPTLVGKYTCRQNTSNATCSTLYLIDGYSDSTSAYVIPLNSNSHYSQFGKLQFNYRYQSPADVGYMYNTRYDYNAKYYSMRLTISYYNYIYTYGDSYIDNGNGTYTITNTDGTPPGTTDKTTWNTDYTKVGSKKYVCANATNNTCRELWYVISTSSDVMIYIKQDNYKYAKEYEYKKDPSDGVYKYFLKDDNSVIFWDVSDNANITSLNTYHYTCWNTTGVCEQISYIYFFQEGASSYYIILKDGKDVDTAVQEMLYLDNNSYHVNTNNSIIKTGIDAWYKKYILTDFDQYIEDTIYCNDRRQSNSDINGWNQNGGDLSKFMDFYRVNDLICSNDTDKFSTQNSKAQLTYKVGLATYPEMNLLGNENLKNSTQYYWIASPSYYNNVNASGYSVYSNGAIGNIPIGATYAGVRPVVSLIPGIEYSSGNGSMEQPYKVVDGS